MQVVSVDRKIEVAVEKGRSSITLQANEPYVMHDVEVVSGNQAGAFSQVSPLPVHPAMFTPHAAGGGRLILPFIGGLGDAVSILPVLAALARQHPAISIDVATTTGPAELFDLCPHVKQVISYPTTLSTWQGYEHFLTMEVVQRTAQRPGRALPEVFAAALGIELADSTFELRLPRAAEAAAEPSAVPLVGVAVGEVHSLRSYPEPKLRELVSLLVRDGLCCVLFGHAAGSFNVPVCPPVVTDMRSKTPTVLELAVWLKAVDVVVSHDSLVMHLAGALGRPTVALFAPTSRTHASPYASAIPLASSAGCSPCHATANSCPKGFDRCVAWDDTAVEPGSILETVRRRLGKSRTWTSDWVASLG